MAGKVGEAFVEVVADYKAFAQRAERELNVLLKRLGANADFEPMTEASGDAGEDGGREYAERFEREVTRTNTRSRFRRIGQRVGALFNRSVGEGAESDRRGNLFTRLLGGDDGGRDRDTFQRMFAGLGGGLASTLGGVFGFLANGASTALSAIGSLSTSILTFVALAALIAPVIYVATAALVSMSGALIPLTVGAVALLGIVPVLMAAFSGFGEALGAIASGDAKKMDEALKKLSPSARAVARDFHDLWPQLKRVQQTIQEAFFAPLVGDLDKIGERLLPKITPGLERLSTLLGNMASTFLEKLSSPAGVKFFETTLDTIADIVERSGPGIERLFSGLADAFIASLPFAEKLFGAITDGLGDFGEFIESKVADGSFQQFLEDALATGKEFMGVIGDLIELFGALFEDTDEGGKRFLKDIRQALQALTDFFKSKDGKEALRLMIDLAKLFGMALVGVAAQAGSAYRKLKMLWQMAKDAWNILGKVIDRAERAATPAVAAGLRALRSLPFFADGGLVSRPTLGVIGEAGPEVVVPLTKPGRARELMEQTGLVNLAAGMGGGGDTQVIVYLGTEQITDILDQRVVKGMRAQGKRLAQGVREG